MIIRTANEFGKKSLLLIPESEEESKIIDEYLGSTIPGQIEGKVDLEDADEPTIKNFLVHYVQIWKK